jgi:methylenetetrahydrofolate--tRNA-(uracil-5-)-methyltransferase
MRRLDSLVLRAADSSRVPAGSALAVDRQLFAQYLTATIEQHPLITLLREEFTELPANPITIVATGPLTSEAMANQIQQRLGSDQLYFYDALSPIVAADSIDYHKTFFASRYGIGDGDDYLNCPLDQETYCRLWQDLSAAECITPHDFEQEIFFEACLPIEEMARRGRDTLAFGPFKPVGLNAANFPAPYAVVQLRLEDHTEQRRIFRTIPGLEQAEFLRLGSVHRNTYLNAPRLLKPTLQTKQQANLFFAGQITGVEGYMESAATGLLAGRHAVALWHGQALQIPPPTTAHGALLRYIAEANPATFQPMNINFGLLPPLQSPPRQKRARRAAMITRALDDLTQWQQQVD